MLYIISYLLHWEEYLSAEFLNLLHAMRDEWGWQLLRAPEWQKAIRVPGNTILFFECYPLVQEHAETIKAYPGRKLFYTDDFHFFEAGTREMKTNVWCNFRTMLCSNAHTFHQLYPEYEDRWVVNFPHCANDDFLLEMNPDPLPRALLTGYLHSSYPQRMDAFWLSQQDDTIPLDYLYHPGYLDEYKHVGKKGKDFAQHLWRYLACVTDGGMFNYILAKNFEIPAVGALLITHNKLHDVLAMNGFLVGVHYISYGNAIELEERVRWAVAPENREAVNAMRAAGWGLIRHRHTTRHRAHELHTMLISIPC